MNSLTINKSPTSCEVKSRYTSDTRNPAHAVDDGTVGASTMRLDTQSPRSTTTCQNSRSAARHIMLALCILFLGLPRIEAAHRSGLRSFLRGAKHKTRKFSSMVINGPNGESPLTFLGRIKKNTEMPTLSFESVIDYVKKQGYEINEEGERNACNKANELLDPKNDDVKRCYCEDHKHENKDGVDHHYVDGNGAHPDHIKMLYYYSTIAFGPLNDAMRRHIPAFFPMINLVCSSLLALPPVWGTFFRGYDGLRQEQPICMWAPTSMSSLFKEAEEIANLRENSRVAAIFNVPARSIGKYAMFPSEDEFVFCPDPDYKVEEGLYARIMDLESKKVETQIVTLDEVKAYEKICQTVGDIDGVTTKAAYVGGDDGYKHDLNQKAAFAGQAIYHGNYQPTRRLTNQALIDRILREEQRAANC